MARNQLVLPCTCALLTVVLSCVHALSQLPTCSTQKVNGNCQLVFDRLDPISLPTIQMRPKARISVSVIQALPYELLSLDPQSFQGVAPADQMQGLAAAVLPSLKGINTPQVTPAADTGRPVPIDKKVQAELDGLNAMLDNPFPTISKFITNSQSVYAQLDETVSPLPRPRNSSGAPQRATNIPDKTPFPWSVSYPDWRRLMLCELSGSECDATLTPAFCDLMAMGIRVQASLTTPPPTLPPPPAIVLPSPPCPTSVPTPPGTPSAPPLAFDEAGFNTLVAATTADIAKLPDANQQKNDNALLQNLKAREASLTSLVPVYAAAWLPGVQAINKDLQSYYVNIKETVATGPSPASQPLGYIDDPRQLSKNTGSSTKFLGRLVTYSVNAVNQISVMTTAVPTSAQKSSIATITVLYADPIFEVSTGALFSTIPNRTFANQTLVTGSTATQTTTGNVIITQSTIRPTVLPYAAANWRLGHDFLMPDGHRGAAYFTTAVAFNAYNTTAEYAVGPTLSWRMIMLSPLFHIGHDVHLTQGETINQVWCTTVPGMSNTCAGSPPAPSTTTFWKGGFAMGIGIRVPTSFGTTAGH